MTRRRQNLSKLTNEQLEALLQGSGGRYLLDVSEELSRVEPMYEREPWNRYWLRRREEILRQSVYDAV